VPAAVSTLAILVFAISIQRALTAPQLVVADSVP
jgi:hypothetical protein